jgi:hypothetical protein
MAHAEEMTDYFGVGGDSSRAGKEEKKMEERRIERRTASMRDQMTNAKEELYH